MVYSQSLSIQGSVFMDFSVESNPKIVADYFMDFLCNFSDTYIFYDKKKCTFQIWILM